MLLLAFVVCLAILAMAKQMVYSAGSMGVEKTVVIEKGSTSVMVARKLFDEGVISYPLLFRVVARIKGLDKNLKAGEYLFASHISLIEVIEQMAKGEIMYRKITLPEGLTTAQMLDLIAEDEFLSGDISLEPLEGELLPETYSYSRGDSKDSIIRQAKDAMNKALDKAWENKDEHLPIKNKKQLLILASIIEKETGVSEERGLVASVFVNRLRKGMKLQTDPTVIYALTKGKKELGRVLLRKDLEIDSLYNTYKYYGLPPAPICNPGKDSLKAAANPEISNYLYFVASGNGGHNFATSLNEHNKNVKAWKNKK